MDALLSPMTRENLAPRAVAAAAVVAGLLTLHHHGPSPWPWAVLAAAVAAAAYASPPVAAIDDELGRDVGEGRLHDLCLLRGTDAVEAMAAAPDKARKGGDAADTPMLPPLEFLPDMFFVQRLEKKENWIRTDAGLAEALLLLRPYLLTEGPTVSLIIRMLGEFYRRYDQLLNRPSSVYVAHAYVNLHDLHLAILNTIHELHFRKPPLLNQGLLSLAQQVQARTTRMLRILRHKYPAEVRGVADAVAGGAPRAHDPSPPPSSPGHASYAVFA